MNIGQISTAQPIAEGRLVRRVGGRVPLLSGKQNIGANISELTHHGSRPRSHKQIVAIAMHVAEKKKGVGGSTKIGKLKIPKMSKNLDILKAMNIK